jgi:hypothetical protein
MSDLPALYVRRSEGIVAALGVGARRVVVAVDHRVPSVLAAVEFASIPTGVMHPPKPPAEVDWPVLE